MVRCAGIAHLHCGTIARIVCNGNIKIVALFVSDLLNPHLIDFTFLPIRVVGVDFGNDWVAHTTTTLWTILTLIKKDLHYQVPL